QPPGSPAAAVLAAGPWYAYRILGATAARRTGLRRVRMSVAIREGGASQTRPQAGRAPAIVLDGLHLAYAGHDVFRDLDLVVTPGQVYGLIRPSGGGQTTILRAATG